MIIYSLKFHLMKPLLTSSDIRNAIRAVLADPDDHRIIAVGFVGAQPLEWLPSPKGIELYCWPRAGATQPGGIDKLLAAGVRVHFVDRLHTKIYWGHNTGAVIGSANLSHNALGDDGLIEAGMLLGPGDKAVKHFLLSLKANAIGMDDPRFAGILEKLRLADMDLRQRNPQSNGRGPHSRASRSFGEWLTMTGREQWQLGWWVEEDLPPLDTTAQHEESHGGKSYSKWRSGTSKHDLKPFVATIEYKTCESHWGVAISYQAPLWWYPEQTRISTEKVWSDSRYQWYAKINVPSGRDVPFDIREKRFLKALDSAVEAYGNRMYKLRGPVKGRFLDLLTQHYERTIT